MILSFNMETIKEGDAEVFIPIEKKISKKLPVFYNPVMKANRDITILLLKQFPKMSLCDPLAGTGIRSIRFAKELKFDSITANDLSQKAAALMEKNMRHNNVEFKIINKDANIMLLESEGFDYIDLDVFGCPNFVLDSSIKRLSRKGILAVTATDTSALSGTYPSACMRKYWAKPIRSEIMHEAGIRILIRKIQLVGAQYDKALIPIFCFSKDHYFRIFLKCKKGKSYVDKTLKYHKECIHISAETSFGPLWVGPLWDVKLSEDMLKDNKTKENHNMLSIIAEEAKVETVFFYDLQKMAKREKFGYNPKKQDIIDKIKFKGYNASETHFLGTGIRTDMNYNDLSELIKTLYDMKQQILH